MEQSKKKIPADMHAFMRELIREVLAETIRKVDGKYVVYPKHGGKRLGTHSSRKAAEKQLTAIHLNKEGYVLKNLEKEHGIDLDLFDKGDYLTLDRIVIPKEKRKEGLGSDIMDLITQYADANGKKIYLTPSVDFGGTSVGRLEKFYKRFGFRKKPKSDFSNKETMVREPQTRERKEVDIIPGGLAKGMSIEDLAKRHNLSVKQTSDLLKAGTQVELEHTTSLQAAREIAMDHIYEDPYYYEKLAKIEEKSLRSWFDEKWVRIDTQGNITGPCGTMKNKQRPSRCLPKAKAQSLTKAQRAATARKKKAGKGQFVPNTKKAKVTSEELFETFFAILESDYTPTNKDLWSRAIAAAKRKFTKYPSAYANAWASKWYKGKGGGWRKKKKK